jgi:hypothetical membrane protein
VAGVHNGTWKARRRGLLIGAAAGIAGPAVFTIAWVVAGLRQPGRSLAAAQISGLAADDAHDPWIMMSGFAVLGGCAVVFGAGLANALGGRRTAGPGPALIQVAGVLTVAAGLLRRDHVLLTAGPASWHNHAHDVVSAASYLLLVAAPVVLARRLARNQRWRRLPVPLAVAACLSGGLLIVFYASPHQGWDGTLQRIAVSLPLAAVTTVAARLARLAGATSPMVEPEKAHVPFPGGPPRSGSSP